jgi:NDP-sugar pyrophosphorylase family protein
MRHQKAMILLIGYRLIPITHERPNAFIDANS